MYEILNADKDHSQRLSNDETEKNKRKKRKRSILERP